MKNVEVLNNLNNLKRYIAREVENNRSFVNTSAKFKIKKNLKTLNNVYEIYNECMQEIFTKYDLQPNADGSISIAKDNPNADNIQKELQDLLNVQTEVVIERISDKDFVEDCLIGDELLLEFMTDESEG